MRKISLAPWKWLLKLKILELLRKLSPVDDVYYVGSGEALPPPLSADEEVS